MWISVFDHLFDCEVAPFFSGQHLNPPWAPLLRPPDILSEFVSAPGCVLNQLFSFSSSVIFVLLLEVISTTFKPFLIIGRIPIDPNINRLIT